MEIQTNPQTIDLQSIQDIESVVDWYIANGDYTNAEVFYKRFIDFSQKNSTAIISQGQRIMERYATAAAKIGWYILERLPQEDIRVLFEEHLEFFFTYPWEFVQTELERVLVKMDDFSQRDDLKNSIHHAIQYSLLPFGKKNISVNGKNVRPTIQNWVRDFDLFIGEKDATDPLLITQYLNTSSNVSALSSEQRAELEGLLRFTIATSLSSFTPQGNEDVIIFHDVDSGHIKYIDHGKEIDTGASSDVIAKMTPEERAKARQTIQERLAEIDKTFQKGFVIESPILEQQLSRNDELRRAIAKNNKNELTTVVSSVPPRVTLPQQPVAPVAPKKVEPIQVVMPTPPQPVAVSVAPKPRIMPIPAAVPAPVPMSVMPTAAPAPAPVPQVPVAPKPISQAPVIPKPTPIVAPVQPQVPKKQTEGIDYASLAELVLAEHALLLASVEAENRFLSLIAAFAKGERTRDEVITTLTMPIESGGVNITADIAASCLNTAERFTQGAQLRNRRRPQAAELTKKAQPTFQQVTDMMQRHKEFEDTRAAQTKSADGAVQQSTLANFLSATPAPMPSTNSPRTGVEDIFANLDVAQMQQKSVAPETNSPIRRIDSIRTQQPRPNGKQQFEQVMGPMQELQKFAIADLRAFGKNPETATAFIKEKIDLQTQESISKRAEAIRAWQESPLHQLYVQIGNASLTQGMPVNQYIQQREQTGQETLTAAEFDAIASLNRQLRF